LLPLHGAVMSKVFISYRRDDSAGYAHAIHSKLGQYFSKDQVFMDVDTVEPGVDFVRVIEEAVGECDVLIALIGKRWASVDSGTTSRLHDPEDFVGLEISTALARDIRVVPVLVDGITMPSEKMLPPALKALTRRQAMEISHTRYEYDVGQVISAIRGILGHDKRHTDVEERNAGEERNRANREVEQPKIQTSTGQLVLERLETRLDPGAVFRDKLEDSSQGPEMMVIPTGTFRMGDLQSKRWTVTEKPVHEVKILKPFAMGRYEVTFEEYDRFAAAIGRKLPDDGGLGRGRQPVINVSWDEALAFTDWLSNKTAKRYRLPSEAEWEYAARGGTETPYWWGDKMKPGMANCNRNEPSLVGSFPANPFGLYDIVGNVGEWIQDDWHWNYHGAPTDGSAWEGIEGTLRRLADVWFKAANSRVVRGRTAGGLASPFDINSVLARVSFRLFAPANDRSRYCGFRLARDLD
jgi:formylglycine-generating enzyme required for sulfatase activity